MVHKVFSLHLIKRPICTCEYLVTEPSANKSLLKKLIFWLHVGQLVINLNPVKCAWRYQEHSMASSKGALISLTFPVIISMPIQPPTIYQQEQKRQHSSCVSG